MFVPHAHHAFIGAKLALFIGSKLLCLHRDDKPGLLWPGFWDLPGGGREPGETPLQTVLRETQEEFTLTLPASTIHWGRAYTSSIGISSWFFVGALPARVQQDVVLGDEGQGWQLMERTTFLAHDNVVPQFQSRLQDYLEGASTHVFLERPPAD